MENKQTAVEFIEGYIELKARYYSYNYLKLLIEKAKEMEKEQIIRAYMSGEVGEIFELKNTLTAKQYFENNYGK